jgi:hypothetical protein
MLAKHDNCPLESYSLHELLYLRLCVLKCEGMLQDIDLSTKTDEEISDIDIRALGAAEPTTKSIAAQRERRVPAVRIQRSPARIASACAACQTSL